MVYAPSSHYDDMVDAQYRLATEGFGFQHVPDTWLRDGWHGRLDMGREVPDFMDALVPMASQPSAMSSRNWMMRRLIIDSIRNDPEWTNGNYSVQPHAARIANVFRPYADQMTVNSDPVGRALVAFGSLLREPASDLGMTQ